MKGSNQYILSGTGFFLSKSLSSAFRKVINNCVCPLDPHLSSRIVEIRYVLRAFITFTRIRLSKLIVFSQRRMCLAYTFLHENLFRQKAIRSNEVDNLKKRPDIIIICLLTKTKRLQNVKSKWGRINETIFRKFSTFFYTLKPLDSR